jgi:prophage regulatory protein
MVYDTSSQNTKFIRILRWPEVQSRVGFSKSYAYVLQAKGLFPKPIKLIEGGRAMGYIESEVDEYIETRIRLSRRNGDE